ncbi:hypothetical protein Lesp02_06690 [Lentzea sp. NBRC 105346]|uniref:YciI family protein n=1 Tax=Lentzea sp. NBRC 105346 TaxID=3032205 RepID=UPI0024A5AF29|nr:YciI family protein [Lentzea sp. NBRC 105346]GLZ28479.1 hypothetical protein Lesp02_06690 [Lentzea sp. NBRC 105346]
MVSIQRDAVRVEGEDKEATMQYVLNVIEPAHEPGDIPPPEVLEPIMKNVQLLEREMKDAGVWVFSSSLAHPATSTVVRVNDGEVLLTDGPFAEGKEHIGGFTLIEAGDLDEALRWARRSAELIGLPIEVRPTQGVH